LYRAARAAGVPADIVETFIRALATRISVGRDVAAADRFDLVIDRERAATGETRLGELQLAAIDGAHPLTLVRWTNDGGTGWWDANGENERRGELAMPVAGHITSGFGPRFHPILGFTRLHQGIDIGAPVGTPVIAVVDGRVQRTGWTGGSGNYIELVHTPTLATAYRHLSRIAVRPGEMVRRGAVIGYVGSTGLSTGPHLHWEVWRDGKPVNPMGLSLDSVARLVGDDLHRFNARVAALRAVAG
ncbi:M23 family metallopeptidase, partial [Sphingomonas bacterium]|uniref:M23 family metallopeptidase n=1 Tax=Sphingomonas bacterium TaxID=1895847 RepID=UPI0015751761